jgi:hypothetical protein
VHEIAERQAHSRYQFVEPFDPATDACSGLPAGRHGFSQQTLEVQMALGSAG